MSTASAGTHGQLSLLGFFLVQFLAPAFWLRSGRESPQHLVHRCVGPISHVDRLHAHKLGELGTEASEASEAFNQKKKAISGPLSVATASGIKAKRAKILPLFLAVHGMYGPKISGARKEPTESGP